MKNSYTTVELYIIIILDVICFIPLIFKWITVISNKHTLAFTGVNDYDTRLILCSLQPSLNIFCLLILMKNSYCWRYFNWKKHIPNCFHLAFECRYATMQVILCIMLIIIIGIFSSNTLVFRIIQMLLFIYKQSH